MSRKKPVGMRLDADLLDQIQQAHGNGRRTAVVESALKSALPEQTDAESSGWRPEPGSPFYRSPAELLANRRSENEWKVESTEEDMTRWQPSWDWLRVKLRDERRRLEALKPKWSPAPFGRLLSMFYAAVDADEADTARLMGEYHAAREVAEAEEYARRAAWQAYCKRWRAAQRAAKAEGVELDEAAWDAEQAKHGAGPEAA
jgi:hypothetical protein